MTSFTKIIDFSFKILQGLASFLTIIIVSRFLSIEEYSYFSILGMILVSLCTFDLGFNTQIINNFLGRRIHTVHNNRVTQSYIFFQIFKRRKKTLFRIFLLQIILLIPVYFFLEQIFNSTHSSIYLLVISFSLLVMYLGSRLSTYLIALGRARTLFKIQGYGSIMQLLSIAILGKYSTSLIYYIPILAVPNLLVMIPIAKDWLKFRKFYVTKFQQSISEENAANYLSAPVQIAQVLQFLQGLAVPLILARIFDNMIFAIVVTQYRICLALLSSVGTLTLSEWSSINQEDIDELDRKQLHRLEVVVKYLKKYLLLLGSISVLLPVFGTMSWNFLNSKIPSPPLISWILWGLVLIFHLNFNLLSIIETRRSRYGILLYMNSVQVSSCIFLLYLPLLQKTSTYPLIFSISYLVGILGTLVIKR